MLSDTSKPLIVACRAAGTRGAETWEEIAEELSVVRVKDVEEVLRLLAGLSEEQVNMPTVRLAAFCYGACAGPLDCRTELTKRAALTLQRLLIVGQADEETLPFALEAAERFPLHARRERSLSAKSIAQSAAANYAYLSMFGPKKSLDPKSRERVEAARENSRKGSKLQLAAARELFRIDPDELMAVSESLIAAADCESAESNYGIARGLLDEALEILEEHGSLEQSGYPRMWARVCMALAEVLISAGEKKQARQHLTQVEAQLRHVAETGASDVLDELVRVLIVSADVAEQTDDLATAKEQTEAALELLEQTSGSDSMELGLRQRLVSLVTELEGEKSAQYLRDTILHERGVREAAWAGHEKAAEVMELAWESLRELDTAGPWNEVSAEDRLLHMLNLDPPTVEEYVQCLGQSAYAVKVGQENQLPCNPDWQRWRALRVLQTIADIGMPLSDQPPRKEALTARPDTLRVQGLTLEDVEVLRVVLNRASISDIFVQAGAQGGSDGSYLNYALPDMDYYCGPLPLSESVDLLVRSEKTMKYETTQMDLWIAEGLKMLAGALLRQEPDIRRCRMPRGVKAQLDFWLGEEDKPEPEKCGRYYIPEKGAETCDRGTCQTYHGKLQPRKIVLKQRAKELAMMECLAEVPDIKCGDLWDEVSNGREPAEALAAFRERLKGLG